MKTAYELSKLKGHRNPYAKRLKKQRPVRAKIHKEVVKPFLKDAKFRKGYEEELNRLQLSLDRF